MSKYNREELLQPLLQRISFFIAAAIFVIAGGFWLLPRAQEWVDRAVAALEEEVLQPQLEPLGIEISIGTIEPRFIFGLQLREVELNFPPYDQRIKVGSITAQYDLISLLLSPDDGILASLQLSQIQGRLSQEYFDSLNQDSREEGWDGGILSGVDIGISDSTLEWNGSDFGGLTRILSAKGRIQGSQLAVEMVGSGHIQEPESLEAGLYVQAVVDLTTLDFNGVVKTSEIYGFSSTVTPQELALQYTQGLLMVSSTFGTTPASSLEYSLRYDPIGQRGSATLSLTDFAFRDLFFVSPWDAGVIELDSDIRAIISSSRVQGSIQLQFDTFENLQLESDLSLVTSLPQAMGFLAGPVSAEIRLVADQNNFDLLVEQLSTSAGSVSAQVAGTNDLSHIRIPVAQLDLDPLVPDLQLAISGLSIADELLEGRISFSPSTFPSNELSVSFKAQLGQVIEVDTGVDIRDQEGNYPLGEISATLDSAGGDWSISSNMITLDSQRILAIVNALDLTIPPLPDLRGEVQGIRASGNTRSVAGLSLGSSTVSVEGLGEFSFIEIKYENGQFSFDQLVGTIESGPQIRVSGEGRGDFAQDKIQAFIRGSLQEIPLDIALESTSNLSDFSVTTSDGLELEGSVTDGSVDLRVVLSQYPLENLSALGLPPELTGAVASVSGQLKGTNMGQLEYEVMGRVENAYSGTFSDSLDVEFSLTGNERTANITSLRAVDTLSDYRGNGFAIWSESGDSVAGGVQLNDADDGRTLEANFSIAPSILRGNVITDNFILSRFPVEGIRGNLDSRIDIAIEGDSSEITGRLETENAFLAVAPLSISAIAQGSISQLVPSQFEVVLGDFRYRGSESLLNLETLDFASQGIFSIQGRESSVSLEADLDGERLDNPLGALTGFLDIVPYGEDPVPWRFGFEGDELGLSISGGTGGFPSFVANIENNGDFEISTRSPFPLSLDGRGRIEADRITVDLPNVQVSVPDISFILDFGIFAVTEGEAQGSLRISGPISDPDFYGALTVRNVEAQLDMLSDTIGPSPVFLVMDGKTMGLNGPALQVGEDGFASVDGAITFSQWIPARVNINVVVPDQQPLSLAYDFDSIQVIEGIASANLIIESQGPLTSVGGQILVHRAQLQLSPVADSGAEPVQDPGPRPGGAGTAVDLNLITGEQVEFFWPNVNIPILRGVADPGADLILQYNDLTNDFAFRGTLPFQNGDIYYLDRNFLVFDGTIEFNEDENLFDPIVNTEGVARAFYEDQAISLLLRVPNQRLSELNPITASDPPIPQDDLLLLFSGNPLANADDSIDDIGEVVGLTASFATELFVIRSIEGTLRNALNLDVFSVRSPIVGNLLSELGRIDGGTTVIAPQNLLANTTVQIGKFLGQDVFFQTLLQIKSSSNTLGTSSPVELFAEFGLDWETPFADVSWRFSPQTPDTLFLSDHEFTLTWEIQ